MVSKAPREDPADEVRIRRPKQAAAGVSGVLHGLSAGLTQMGAKRTALTLLRINQPGGFDCPGCAWPEADPQHRHTAEFCENGAKAVAEEATLRRVGPRFFAAHPIAELAQKSDYWLGQQGRLTEPMVRRPGEEHYQPISWDGAFALIASELRGRDPGDAVFYTSGRTSNEAAFLYQLFARAYGTNNLPDCSNMCHESSGTALTETIGVGKGSVTLEDIHHADLLVVVGQNPGTNHPRMLTALETAKRNGARIVAVNPLPEAGLLRFRNPQRPSGIAGPGTQLADDFLQIRVNGDLALFQAAAALLISRGAVDHSFISAYTDGFSAYREHLARFDWAIADAATGLTRAEIERFADTLAESKRTIVCWAMGLTQHKNSVATIREIVNVLLLGGHIGRPGAGVCPVRGHSNVQGDRTMGINEKAPPKFLDALRSEFGFEPPREHGYDVVDAIRAMRDGRASVFVALGGNFAAATPDSEVTAAALRRCALTVQISTKLNRSHAICGETALILPTLGRTERDVQASGEQAVSVEDSMSNVHASRGRLDPASPDLLSEVAIVSRLARAVLGDSLGWAGFEADYAEIRDRISRVVPGFADYERRIADPAGFTLPHPPRDSRSFPTATGRANFTVNELHVLRIPPGRLLLQTVRSHDQYNTTIYGLDDRYRGISAGRRVVFVSPGDLATLGIADGTLVDLVSEWTDGSERRAPAFRVVAYPTAARCAAAYFPEANALVPLDSTADGSNTPTSKSVIVRLEPVS
jgi:molybdopterin-dependent oxidoreductase alpha subunit